jgi:beta-glucosidase/6-phospho-beta-glucosidase/beta-galactosidase
MTPTDAAAPGRLFRSFWMAGFECSCQINSAGVRLDMTSALQHDVYAAEDYRRLREVGIATARDGVRWHLVDRAGELRWESWLPMLRAARDESVQVLWDLCHYGWPDDLDILSADFIDRFARFAGEAARIHREETGEAGFWAPVNEMSFFAWAATRELMFPYAWGRGVELKRQLVTAAVAAIDAIRSAAPGARIVYAEPLIHNVPPRWRPWNTEPARAQRASQFEALDQIAAAAADYLDIVGVNFYAANQWEVPGGRKLHWDAGSNDSRWVPLHRLLAEVQERYRRPLFIAETSHYGIGRGDWIAEIARECRAAIDNGVPIEGVCLYPILDRFDWEDCKHWHNSGLWDMVRNGRGHYRRVLNGEYARALREAQAVVGAGALTPAPH